MIRTIAVLLLVAVLSSPVALGNEEEPQDDEPQEQQARPCDVYRQNPSGGPFNRIMIDPDGCWRSYVQSLIDTGFSTYNEANGG